MSDPSTVLYQMGEAVAAKVSLGKSELLSGTNTSQSDSDKIEGYLAHKWGLESKLPVGHTYKTTAP